MDLEEISRSLQQLWESEPVAVLLGVLGFLVFVFLVIDTWRHRRWRKRQR